MAYIKTYSSAAHQVWQACEWNQHHMKDPFELNILDE